MLCAPQDPTSKRAASQIIDYESVRNLELLANARTGGVKGSLLGGIDKTKTSVGAALLRAQVSDRSGAGADVVIVSRPRTVCDDRTQPWDACALPLPLFRVAVAVSRERRRDVEHSTGLR